MSSITDNLLHYEATALKYVHSTAEQGAKLLHENSYFTDYNVRDLTYNVKEAFFLTSALMLLASTIHICLFAASLQSLFFAGVGCAATHLIGKSMDQDNLIGRQFTHKTAEESELAAGQDRVAADDLSSEEPFTPPVIVSDSDSEYDNVDKEDVQNLVPDLHDDLPENEDDVRSQDAEKPAQESRPSITSTSQVSSTDLILTALFRNFIDTQGQPILWTTFIA